jgi:hypothetical protein
MANFHTKVHRSSTSPNKSKLICPIPKINLGSTNKLLVAEFSLIESEDDTRSWELLVSSRIFTLIESENDTRSWKFFLGLLLKLYHNAIPSRGWGYIFIGC